MSSIKYSGVIINFRKAEKEKAYLPALALISITWYKIGEVRVVLRIIISRYFYRY